MSCGCDTCTDIKGAYEETGAIPSSAFLYLYNPDKGGCARTTVTNLLASNSDVLAQIQTAGNAIAEHTDIGGNTVQILETVTAIANPAVTGNDLTFDYVDEAGNTNTQSFTLPTPVSVVNSIDLKPTGNPNEFTVEIVYTNDLGVQTTIADTTPIIVPSVCEQFGDLALAAAVPAGAQAMYRTASGVCGRAPFPAGPTYLTCDDTALNTTDRITTAPTGAFTSGYTVNQGAANGCLTLADTYYDAARYSHTFGKSRRSNDAQGTGSSVTGGLRNTIATAGSYGHIGGGYDHSITTGTANMIGGGRNNDITAGSYNGIHSGYNQNITAGNYNTIGGGVGNDIKAGSYNTIVGGSAIDFEAGTGSYNVAGGVNHTTNGGSYNTLFGNANITDAGNSNFLVGQSNRTRTGSYSGQIGYSHDIAGGGAIFQSGYNHTNSLGSYNTQQGYDHTIVSSSYSTQQGYRQRIDSGNYHQMMGTNNRIRGGNYNIAVGNSHDIQAGTGHSVYGWSNTVIGGNYSFMGGVNSTHRGGNYNFELGYSNDLNGTGNGLIGYSNTSTGNYGVAIGRNLTIAGSDEIKIANSFQKLAFFNGTASVRQTANNLPQLLAALKLYGLIL